MGYYKGRPVEVQIAFATWRRARVVDSNHRTYTVQYTNGENEKEVVLRELVRPSPPFRDNVYIWALGDFVDVRIDNSWKTAQVTDIGFRTRNPDEHLVVLEGECCELTVHKTDLRRSRVFKEGCWISIKKEQENKTSDSSSYSSTGAAKPNCDSSNQSGQDTETSDPDSCTTSGVVRLRLEMQHRIKMQFSVGRHVEVSKHNKWYQAVILCTYGEMLLVRYDNSDIENVPKSQVRPHPPFKDNAIQWSSGDEAELRADGYWMPARVKGAADMMNFMVVSTDQLEESVVHRQQLRRKRVWRNGKWIATLTKMDRDNWKKREQLLAWVDSEESDASVSSCDPLAVSPHFTDSEDECSSSLIAKRRRVT